MSHANLLAVQLGIIVTDLLFLIIWAKAQEYAALYIERIELIGLERWVQWMLQGVFAISTFAPIAIRIVEDILTFFYEARARLRELRIMLEPANKS